MSIYISNVLNSNKLFKLLYYTILIFTTAYIFLQLKFDLNAGGNPWKQGDWLINSEAGLVRRSISGDFIFFLSDISKIPILNMVVLIQTIFLLMLLYFLIYLGNKIPEKIFFLIVCMPAFFPIFWAADPQGSFRKELIIYTTIFLLIYSIYVKNKILIWLTLPLFTFTFFSHEALILFAPTIFAIIAISPKQFLEKKEKIIFSILLILIIISAVIFSLKFSNGPHHKLMCQTLIEKNFSPKICGGAIHWLNQSIYDANKNIISRLEVSFHSHIYFILMYLWSLIPIIYLYLRIPKTFNKFLLFLTTGLPFFLLYFIALDYGRWMNFHIFSMVSLFFIFELTNKSLNQEILKIKNIYIFLFGLSQAFLISPTHTIGIEKFSVLGELRYIIIQAFN